MYLTLLLPGCRFQPLATSLSDPATVVLSGSLLLLCSLYLQPSERALQRLLGAVEKVPFSAAAALSQPQLPAHSSVITRKHSCWGFAQSPCRKKVSPWPAQRK